MHSVTIVGEHSLSVHCGEKATYMNNLVFIEASYSLNLLFLKVMYSLVRIVHVRLCTCPMLHVCSVQASLHQWRDVFQELSLCLPRWLGWGGLPYM